MNLWVLEYVIAVAEHGGVTPVGEELRISQPALSKAVQQLKVEYATLVSEGRGEPVEGELSIAVPAEGAVNFDRGAGRRRRGLPAATACEIS